MELVLSRAGQGRTIYLAQRALELSKQGKSVKYYSSEEKSEAVLDIIQKRSNGSLPENIDILYATNMQDTFKDYLKNGFESNTVYIFDSNKAVVRPIIQYPAEQMSKLPIIVGVQMAAEFEQSGVILYEGMTAYQIIQNDYTSLPEGKVVFQSKSSLNTQGEQSEQRLAGNLAIQGNQNTSPQKGISADFRKKD